MMTQKSPHSSCCHHDSTAASTHDWMFLGSLCIVALLIVLHLTLASTIADIPWLATMSHMTFELFTTIWWGLVIGIISVGILGKIPREFVICLLGNGGSITGVFRATFAGLLMDLCSHGILMVGMKLYERGASTGQIMAFLIASPWNSLSLTLILIALIGIPWTLTFIALSFVIAIISGIIFDTLVKRGILPTNPHSFTLPKEFHFFPEAKKQLAHVHINRHFIFTLLKSGAHDSQMVLKWTFIGIILAALLRTIVPADTFGIWFAPTIGGLMLTVTIATVLEVCSEGSAPIAADILTRANAGGNSFAFLMTGVSTDYTEILSIKSTTKSWKIALFLPLITLPQIIFLAYLLNHLSG